MTDAQRQALDRIARDMHSEANDLRLHALYLSPADPKRAAEEAHADRLEAWARGIEGVLA